MTDDLRKGERDTGADDETNERHHESPEVRPYSRKESPERLG
jgi:hypothetical protein